MLRLAIAEADEFSPDASLVAAASSGLSARDASSRTASTERTVTTGSVRRRAEAEADVLREEEEEEAWRLRFATRSGSGPKLLLPENSCVQIFARTVDECNGQNVYHTGREVP